MVKAKKERQEEANLPASSQLAHLLAITKPTVIVPRHKPTRHPKPAPKYFKTLTETDVQRLVHLASTR